MPSSKQDQEFLNDRKEGKLPWIHELKSWPEEFETVRNGYMPFQVRKHDRDFSKGDTLLLLEYRPEDSVYTGSKLMAKVSYVAGDVTPGVVASYCVIGLVLGANNCSFDPLLAGKTQEEAEALYKK